MTILVKKVDKSHRNITIVGVGNRILGDEGVGLHIINKLSRIPMPPYVNIIDCGCDLLSLLSYINEPAKIFILDAVRTGGQPGEIYNLDYSRLTAMKIRMSSAHQVRVVDALRLLKLVSPALADSEIIVIGIEPKTMKLTNNLSKEVRESITKVMMFILKEISVLFSLWYEEKQYKNMSA